MKTVGKIFPRNLTARAAHQVAGNPDISRPEDAVANCYPGLELDVRNLDRRFFPGLLFNYIARPDNSEPYKTPMRYGARLVYKDFRNDPDLAVPYSKEMAADLPSWVEPLAKNLLGDLRGDKGAALDEGTWYIDWIEQGSNRRIFMNRRDGTPLDGLAVWRIVRGLAFAPVTLGLRRRIDDKYLGREVAIQGWRRRFTDARTGVLSMAYQPGEMLQSLCSPWQHDFRDCSCHYWASNRPDIVHGEIYPEERVLPDGRAEDPDRATMLLDWMRADHSRAMAAPAQNIYVVNRAFQMDHYQINGTWQDLNVVINNTEIGDSWRPQGTVEADPYGSPEELATVLRNELGPLEMTLALEYLYARFSLLAPEDCSPDLPMMADDMLFARHVLLLVAVAEMEHLRAVNQLLWLLYQARFVKEFSPVLTPAEYIPTNANDEPRKRCLRRLTPDTLADFIAIEHPSGRLDGAYARTVATLRQPYYQAHEGLLQIAERVVADGVEHYQQLKDLNTVLQAYKGASEDGSAVYPYLRKLELGSEVQAREALELYRNILKDLEGAYGNLSTHGYAAAGHGVGSARAAMTKLLTVGDGLAAKGIGIPFWTT